MTLGSELLRFKKNQKYFLPDFETEGLNLFYARPWQAAYLTFTLDKNLTSNDLHIWWDDLKVSEGAARKTNFNYQSYKSKAVDAKIVCAELDKHFYDEDYIIVFQNGLRFDIMIHQTLRRLCGKSVDFSYLERCIDTDSLGRAYFKKIQPDKQNFLAWQYKMSGIIEKGLKSNLAHLGKEFKINFDEAGLHNATNDTALNAEVFRNFIWKMEI